MAFHNQRSIFVSMSLQYGCNLSNGNGFKLFYFYDTQVEQTHFNCIINKWPLKEHESNKHTRLQKQKRKCFEGKVLRYNVVLFAHLGICNAH